jgi:hypothetical protein
MLMSSCVENRALAWPSAELVVAIGDMVESVCARAVLLVVKDVICSEMSAATTARGQS